MDEPTRNFAKVLYHYKLIDDTVYDKVKIKCPFHGDDKPSLQVNIDKDYFYCYGCGAKGDILEFVRRIEKCSPLKAIIIYNKIIYNKQTQNITIKQSTKKTNKEALNDAKIYFYSLPTVDWKHEKKTAALKYMLKRGFTRKVMQECDIRINYNDTYPIIMPMVDNGKFKGYVSRAVVPSDRKYLYNFGFSRRKTLVGNYFDDYVVITEGYMDWLKLQQFGIKNSVAILGWKITDEQISKLQQKGITKIISALDNTPTGEKGTEYLKQYFDVIRFKLPNSIKDIGDLDKFHFNYCWMNIKKQIRKEENK